MDVTIHNFRAALALVRQFLPGSTFVSFDLEFTGLGESRPSQLDNPQTRYAEARSNVDDYVPIQFGLSIFRRLEHAWQVIPFNFNLSPGAVYYPQSARYPLIDRKFTLQGSTVAFLVQHGFDFDKCLRLGVSWLPKNIEKELKQHVEADLRHRRKDDLKETKLDDDVKKLVAKLSEKISKFVKEAEAHPQSPDKQVVILSLPWSGVKRAVAFRHIRTKYPRIVGKPIWTSEGTQLRLQLYKTEEEASPHREDALLQDVDDIVSRAVGFRYVIDLMLEARIPLVVHNGLIDITKLYGTFVGSLPDTLPDFKRWFRKVFPILYDTRLLVEHLASQNPMMQETVIGKRLELSEMVSSLHEIATLNGLVVDFQTFVPTGRVSDIGRLAQANVVSNEGFCIKEGEPWNEQNDRYGFSRYADKGFGHEAGFDAVQTGFLFVLAHKLAEKLSRGDEGIKRLEGKILLTSCGGYQWMDFTSSGEDEVNRWFEKDVFIVSQQSNGKGRLKIRTTLDKLFKGTKFEVTNSDVTFAGPNAFIVLLNTEKVRLSDDTFTELKTKAGQIGVEIRRYSPESLSLHSINKNKKRKFSDII